MQRDGDAVGRYVDALDQQPEDASLLGRVELVPDWLEGTEGVDVATFSAENAPKSRLLSVGRSGAKPMA